MKTGGGAGVCLVGGGGPGPASGGAGCHEKRKIEVGRSELQVSYFVCKANTHKKGNEFSGSGGQLGSFLSLITVSGIT